jgi:hypothetical protein
MGLALCEAKLRFIGKPPEAQATSTRKELEAMF